MVFPTDWSMLLRLPISVRSVLASIVLANAHIILAHYPVAMLILSVVFLLGSLRTNLIFVMLFVSASTAFGSWLYHSRHLSYRYVY